MNFAQENTVAEIENVAIGMVSPDGREGMIRHAEEFAAASIPFIFDPGQGLPMFNGQELVRFIEQASWLTVNDYEWELIHNQTGLTIRQVAEMVNALIVTRGSEGSVIYNDGRCYEIPVVRVEPLNDPTGCGDAYRAGLLYGFLHHLDWETTGRLAAVMGAVKIQSHGTQNHACAKHEIMELFEKSFGYII
jgi:adenosine kinase